MWFLEAIIVRRNFRPQSSQLAEPLWTAPGIKNGTSVRKPISTFKKKLRRGMNDRSFPQNSRKRGKSHHHCTWVKMSFLMIITAEGKISFLMKITAEGKISFLTTIYVKRMWSKSRFFMVITNILCADFCFWRPLLYISENIVPSGNFLDIWATCRFICPLLWPWVKYCLLRPFLHMDKVSCSFPISYG